MDILRIKPIKSGERDFDFLVYYEGGATERVIGKDACYDFIREHSGLEADASDAEISRKVSELVDADVIEATAETDEEIAAAETEFAAAEAARTSDDDDEDLSDDSDDDDEDVEEEEEELREKKKYGAGTVVAAGVLGGVLGAAGGAGATAAILNNTQNQVDADEAYGTEESEEAEVEASTEAATDTATTAATEAAAETEATETAETEAATEAETEAAAETEATETAETEAVAEAAETATTEAETAEDQTVATTPTEFEQLMASMDQSDLRRVASEEAMELVTTFHTQTHKEGNFRLEEDGETYLDLTFEEALVLTTFANYSEPADMYTIFGTYDITSDQAQDLLESARSKMITYYMNSVEPSGLAEIFHSEEDRAFFVQFENDVLTFNKEHTTEASDQVIRDTYYHYVLDDATIDTAGPLARLLAFDTVYGGLNLVESADVDHTQFLVFHGNGSEAETRYLVENIYHLNYDELTEEEKETYRQNIIESSTALVDLLPSGEVMNEENSTQEERDAYWSITELVDRMGLCDVVNGRITELMMGLDNMEATHIAASSAQITNINLNIVSQLYNSGETELATRVAGQVNAPLSAELLEELSHVASVQGLVTNYDTMMGTINQDLRPSMEEIIAAAHGQLEQLDHYGNPTRDDIATLVNNRRHTEFRLALDDSAYGVYPAGEYSDDFIRENGDVIAESEDTHTEEISEDELTDEEREEVEEQQRRIEAQFAKENAAGAGATAGNTYANSGDYSFGTSVTDPANGATYNLDEMSFANGLAYGYAFGGVSVSTSDAQIQAAAQAAAEAYVNSISAEDREAIALGFGTSWESARAQLIESFKSGYISQIQAEISTAISVGQEMKNTSDEMIREIEELNKEDQQETEQQQGTDDEQQLDEGEEPVEDTPVDEQGQQETGEGDQDTSDEEELDQTDDGRVEEGEIPVDEGQPSEEDVEVQDGTQDETPVEDEAEVQEGTQDEAPVEDEATVGELDQTDEGRIEEGEVPVDEVQPTQEDVQVQTQTQEDVQVQVDADADALSAEEAEQAVAAEEARIAEEREAAEQAAAQAAAEQAAREQAEREAAEQAAREQAEREAAEEAARQQAAAEEAARQQAAAEEAARQAEQAAQSQPEETPAIEEGEEELDGGYQKVITP